MALEEEKFIISKYGLRQSALNAFSDKVARPEHLIWWTDRVDEIKQWHQIIEKASKTKNNYLSFIIGSYGRGKTLSLLKIDEEAERYPHIIHVFLNLKGEEKSTPGLDLLFRIFRSIDFYGIVKKIEPKDLNEIIASIPDSFKDLKNTLKAIYFGKVDAFQTSMFSDVVALKEQPISEIALNFIKGYITPNPTQLKEIGVIRKIDKVDIAKEYLAGLLLFFKRIGYSTFVITIDEVEALFSLVTKSQQSIYIALLRSLYDFPMGTPINKEEIANMVLFLGISESGWSSLEEMKNKEQSVGGPTVPLIERVDNSTFLGVFNKEQTRELIEKRLKYNRSDDKFEEQPLIPFTEDFVIYVHEITGGEPRQILVRCGHVIDAGIAEKVTKLDKKFALKVLKERGY